MKSVRILSEAAVVGAVGALAAGLIWKGPAEISGITAGVAIAWLVCGASVLALIFTKKASAFWWGFGGGMALRLIVLAGLMAYGMSRPQTSQAALLLAYVFGVLSFLMLEYRHIELK